MTRNVPVLGAAIDEQLAALDVFFLELVNIAIGAESKRLRDAT